MRRYEATRNDVVARMLALEDAVGERGGAALRAARLRLERGKFVLAVVGEFSTGKSFLLNALLGRFRYEETPAGRRIAGLLAVDINPSTATITEIDYGAVETATAVYESGRTERIPLDALNRFIAVGAGDAGKIHDAVKDERDAPARVVVETSSPFLERGFVLADTPGLASINPAHRRATLHFLPSADAVLYLIDSQQPFAEGDAAFLEIVRGHVDSIFVVQTKIDLLQQRQTDGRAAWEHAHDRIARLAAVHAPGTYVYALSARAYAEGTLDADAALVEASRFEQFLAALDASLIGHTGRARLRRAGEATRSAVADEIARIDADAEMLALPADALRERRGEVVPELDAVDLAARAERNSLAARASETRALLDDRTAALAADLERALSQAFDTADVARLRDRARLHVLVDRVVAAVVHVFAAGTARGAAADLSAAVERARSIAPFRFDLSEAAASAFDAEPGTSLWRGDVADAIAAAIVLDAVGTLATALVHEIALRFSTPPANAYMKRELIADLRAEIFPELRAEVARFTGRIGAALAKPYGALSEELAQAAVAKRDAETGSIERAIRAHETGDRRDAVARLSARKEALNGGLAGVEHAIAGFLGHAPEIEAADPGSPAVRAAHAEPAFDPHAYDRGLRPERWRVAILGALRRGKSSLINAFAGKNVLSDDAAGSARFPIHVRYGDREQAFALNDEGLWNEIPFASLAAAAAGTPVLALVPWSLPRELVLVHVPAFDSGDPAAEDVNVVAASHASEVLCLFSRQLSERELGVFGRVAEFGRPMLFAHTIADNETAGERRRVVELAASYLKERNLGAARIFTVSAHEYAQALAQRRAPAGWNEMDALRSTLEAHAETHMARLDRLARSAKERAPVSASQGPPDAGKPGLLVRLFGKGR
jgi:predicted GTPase